MPVSKSLLEACLNGDRKSQFRLYQECYPVLMSVCCRYRKDKSEATAMLNTGFLKVVNSLPQYREETPFEAWIRKIMIHTLIDDFRANQRRKEIIEYREQIDAAGLDQSFDYNLAEQVFEAEALETMIRELPNMSRQVFNLFAIDGYSHKEIAAMLQISDGTSKWHLNFARKRLQDTIRTKFPDMIRVNIISNK